MKSLRLTQVCIFITLFVIVPAITTHAQKNKHKTRIEKMRALSVLIGEWDLNSQMLPMNQPSISETGTSTCAYLYDSTYIQCDSRLATKGRERSYKTFITYEPDSARYEELYIYDNMPTRILEYGQFDNKEFKTTTSFVNYQKKLERIETSLKIKNQNEMTLESRSSLTNGNIDYTCSYRRKK